MGNDISGIEYSWGPITCQNSRRRNSRRRNIRRRNNRPRNRKSNRLWDVAREHAPREKLSTSKSDEHTNILLIVFEWNFDYHLKNWGRWSILQFGFFKSPKISGNSVHCLHCLFTNLFMSTVCHELQNCRVISPINMSQDWILLIVISE